MLDNVLNATKVALPIAQIGCYATATLFAGRKVLQATAAVGCKMGSHVATLMGKDQMAVDLSSASDRFYASAKNNLVRDLTVAAAFFAAGYTLQKVGNQFTKTVLGGELVPYIQKVDSPVTPVPSGYFESYKFEEPFREEKALRPYTSSGGELVPYIQKVGSPVKGVLEVLSDFFKVCNWEACKKSDRTGFTAIPGIAKKVILNVGTELAKGGDGTAEGMAGVVNAGVEIVRKNPFVYEIPTLATGVFTTLFCVLSILKRINKVL